MNNILKYRPYKRQWVLAVFFLLFLPFLAIMAYHQNDITGYIIVAVFAIIYIGTIFITLYNCCILFKIEDDKISFSTNRRNEKTLHWQDIQSLLLVLGSKHYYIVLSSANLTAQQAKVAVHNSEWLLKYACDNVFVIPLGHIQSKDSILVKDTICQRLAHLSLKEIGQFD